jgi:hypothetical protein
VKLYGKNAKNKQRFKCLKCGHVYIWKSPKNKICKEKHWFKLWINEGYSVRQISKMSGHSQFKLKQINNYWLSKEAPILSNINYKKIKYILFDGTYFHKDGCLIVFIDIQTKKPFYYDFINKEGYHSLLPIIKRLKALGLKPKAFTTDGQRDVIKAFVEIWPNVIIQRCLFHIQRQGLQWLRQIPKTQAARELRNIVKFCAAMKTKEDRKIFLNAYSKWRKKHFDFVMQMPKFSIAFKDLKRTMTLIDNALKDMFHFVKDQNIVPTTNYIENFFKQLKHKYRNHNGLSVKHRIAYLNWYCFFKN